MHNLTSHSISDLLAGYVKDFDEQANRLTLTTSDGRDIAACLTPTTFAEMAHNLGMGHVDATGSMALMLTPGRFLYAYGIYYPESDSPFEIKQIYFLGRTDSEFVFERPDWWVRQIRELGDFYLRAQFGDGPIDWRRYTTMLDLSGHKTESHRQETDTISRLIYGFASAYLLTGEDRFLEAAESGTDYLREHFRAQDSTEEITYWYHAIESNAGVATRKILSSTMADIPGMRRNARGAHPHERKMLASEFSDDYQAIPAYEQIYALAGPTQTYRISGDPAIRHDIDWTLNLFQRFFADHEKGGYYSHIDPVTLDAKEESLGENAGRKNWNSVGDHAPAYLINLILASGEQEHIDMLVDCLDDVLNHFGDYDSSAFVQEKFMDDWSHDSVHGWQQDRAVVGHNLKIAWNAMRVFAVSGDKRLVEFANRIAELMPKHGWDPQRTGWYDVVERHLADGHTVHRFAWHDRKAWWQQEQGILAYLILFGMLGGENNQKYARESAAFYNTFFLDHDSGAVYFNTLANGLPYLLGTERYKGSHSMSGYHSFELCYLAATYTNLLITGRSLDLHFSPLPGAWKDGILRVSPDLLPAGRVKIHSVTIDDIPYADFDADALTVKLPDLDHRPRIKVRVAAVNRPEHYGVDVTTEAGSSRVELTGILDEQALPVLRAALKIVEEQATEEVTFDVDELQEICRAALRAVAMTCQHLNDDIEVTFEGPNEHIREALNSIELGEAVLTD